MIRSINICRINSKFLYIVLFTDALQSWELYLEHDDKFLYAKDIQTLLDPDNYTIECETVSLYFNNNTYYMIKATELYIITCRIINDKNGYKIIATRNKRDYQLIIGTSDNLHNILSIYDINPLKFWYHTRSNTIKLIYGNQILTLYKLQNNVPLYGNEIYPYKWETYKSPHVEKKCLEIGIHSML
jgi:hypothetical protein